MRFFFLCPAYSISMSWEDLLSNFDEDDDDD